MDRNGDNKSVTKVSLQFIGSYPVFFNTPSGPILITWLIDLLIITLSVQSDDFLDIETTINTEHRGHIDAMKLFYKCQGLINMNSTIKCFCLKHFNLVFYPHNMT